jgi:selenocysteine lyase/cysteine desulfurase
VSAVLSNAAQPDAAVSNAARTESGAGAAPVLSILRQRPAPATPARLDPFALVGADLAVPLVFGGAIQYANFDYAASTPSLVAVRDAVDAALPWYASVHRGAGYASQVTTRLYERCRASVRRFLGARRDDAVLFTRNTTDALNLLAHALPAGTTVVVFETEHHASLLPWGEHRVLRLPAPATPAEATAAVSDALRNCPPGPRLVCVTGASNVTGELWPVTDLAQVTHAHGGRIVLDAAQLAPHAPLDVTTLDVDYVAFSGHKLYAPYGAGVLVGRADWLAAADPYLRGGGATREVRADAVVWADLPERQEAGTPNVLGAVALAAACDALGTADRWRLAADEAALLARLRRGLAGIPGVHELALFGPDHPRVGIVASTVDGWDSGELAAALSAEYGIGVRDGLFCAHPFVRHLTGGGGGCAGEPAGRGTAVRASLGLGSTVEQVDRLVEAVRALVRGGARWRYARVDGKFAPTPDPRPWPTGLPSD